MKLNRVQLGRWALAIPERRPRMVNPIQF